MKFNSNCVRDILLTVEENTANGLSMFFLKEDYSLLKNYSDDDIMYYIQQCEMQGFFSIIKIYTAKSYNISCLSTKGHNFLADMQQNS